MIKSMFVVGGDEFSCAHGKFEGFMGLLCEDFPLLIGYVGMGQRGNVF
jgi:hypothetical protein